jgi:hypothetical protein
LRLGPVRVFVTARVLEREWEGSSMKTIRFFASFFLLVGCSSDIEDWAGKSTNLEPTVVVDEPLRLGRGKSPSRRLHHGGSNTACTPGVADDNVVVQWNNAALAAVRAAHLSPPAVARALFIVHNAIFDAWAPYTRRALGTQLGGALRRPVSEHTDSNRAKALSFAAYRACLDLFPASEALFDGLMLRLGYDPGDTSTGTTPSGIGNAAAEALLAFRHQDGSNQLGNYNGGAPYSDYTNYVPVNDPDHLNDPNRWQPLRVPNGTGGFDVQMFSVPQWYKVTPFALTSSSQFRPPPPFLYPSPEYTAQAEQLLRISAELTDKQKIIAEYWADGPGTESPPGHWNLFAQYVSQRDRHSMSEDVEMFFTVTAALFDGGVASWDAKRHYDSVRPISAIRFLYRGKNVKAWGGAYKGTVTMDGANWIPYQAATVVTPPFPEYVSGHSTFSSAAAEALTDFTGNPYFDLCATVPTGSSKFENGLVPAGPVTLCWETFQDAAEQAGMSRLYGGIHFQRGNREGLELGQQVGRAVWRQALSYFNGTDEGREKDRPAGRP